MDPFENIDLDMAPVEFHELEDRYGHDAACAILETLERIEGISGKRIVRLSHEERLRHVFESMRENTPYQTRH